MTERYVAFLFLSFHLTDTCQSLQAAAFGEKRAEIRSFAEALANLERLAQENNIQDTKWGSRFTSAVNTANKHIDELYAGLDTLEKVSPSLLCFSAVVADSSFFGKDSNDFLRLLLTDLKRELINVPVQKKQTPAAPGKPLDVMPHQRGEVKRKKRRTPTLANVGPSATATATATAATGATKRRKTGDLAAGAADDEEEAVAGTATTTGKKGRTPAPKRPKKPAREKKTRVLPLPGSVKAEADAAALAVTSVTTQ